MDCGIPFCHHGCPLGNRIPDWNDLVRTGQWEFASEQLHATNNFPEFTGRLCPAPCEAACVLGIGGGDAVTIKQVEVEIANRSYELGLVTPQPAPEQSGKSVAVVGSGPAGLAAAQQLARAGHAVTVYERDDALGGLMRYGIPDFKLEKQHIDQRLAQLAAEGVRFVTGCAVGTDMTVAQLREKHDAVLLAAGALAGRDMPETAGRGLPGVHLAMEHLVESNRVVAGLTGQPAITAEGKHVVIIGGGDTGADCLGTTHRQGARSVRQLELLSRPPDARAAGNPWPLWPNIFRVSSAHEEGGERMYSISTDRFTGNASGEVTTLHGSQIETIVTNGRMTFKPLAGSEFTLDADLVLLAMGFVGPEKGGLLTELGVKMTDRGTVWRDGNWMTSVPGVFTAGDMQRGQSLIVWAIAEGRSCARGVDTYLMGSSELVAPVL
jgi:glutamate synthase (NADPH/NADH) small chain